MEMSIFYSLSVSLPHSFFTLEPSRLPRFGPEFCEKVDFCDGHKMDTDYNNMTIVEQRVLARARGLRGYTGLRKAGLVSFLQENAIPERPVRPSNVHYDALRMVELMALAREHGFVELFQAEIVSERRANNPA